MSHNASPTALGLAQLTAVAARGAGKAAAGLSELVGEEILLDATGVHTGNSARLLDLVGGPGASVAGVYLSIGDQITGHVMLLFTRDEAAVLVDQLMGQEPGTTTELDEMAQSALGEVGNITAAAFLNELGDTIDCEIHPSPPQVVEEIAGALLDTVLTEVALDGGDMLILETVLTQAGNAVRGFILLTPDPSSLEFLMQRLQAAA